MHRISHSDVVAVTQNITPSPSLLPFTSHEDHTSSSLPFHLPFKSQPSLSLLHFTPPGKHNLPPTSTSPRTHFSSTPKHHLSPSSISHERQLTHTSLALSTYLTSSHPSIPHHPGKIPIPLPSPTGRPQMRPRTPVVGVGSRGMCGGEIIKY